MKKIKAKYYVYNNVICHHIFCFTMLYLVYLHENLVILECELAYSWPLAHWQECINKMKSKKQSCNHDQIPAFKFTNICLFQLFSPVFASFSSWFSGPNHHQGLERLWRFFVVLGHPKPAWRLRLWKTVSLIILSTILDKMKMYVFTERKQQIRKSHRLVMG